MPYIINKPVLKFVQFETHCSFHSATFPSLDKRIDFGFDSLVSGDVLKQINFEGKAPSPLSGRSDTHYEFVGVKKRMWKIPMLDALFFVSKERSGAPKSSIFDASGREDTGDLPFAFTVLFIGTGSKSCLVPKPNRHTQPVGIIEGFDKLYNVTEQRMALVDKDSVNNRAYGALITAASKRYFNDVKLDMLNAFALKNSIQYSQSDVARITGISPRLMRSTYSDKWQRMKNISQDNEISVSGSGVSLTL